MSPGNPENLVGNHRLVVLFCSSLCNALTWGTAYTCGVLVSSWNREFPSRSRAFVALVGSLPVAIGCGLGPVFGVIIQRFGYRRSTCFGGVICFLGWTSSCFMTDLEGLLVTFGIVLGFGGGLANFAASTALNDYYVKDRVLAEGISGSTMCAGLFVGTGVLQKLVDLFEWQGAMLIFGAFHLHIVVLGMFLFHPAEAPNHPLNFFKKDFTGEQHHHVVKFIAEDVNGNSELQEKVVTHKEKSSVGDFFRVSWELAKRPAFMFLLMSDFLGWTSNYIPYVHLYERARLLDISQDTSALISSCNGFGGIFGRLLVALMFYKCKVHPLYAYGVLQLLIGLVTLFSPAWDTQTGLFAFSSAFGFLSGSYGYLKAGVSQVLGKEKFSTSFSWFLLLEGIGIGLGPTIGGFLYSETKSYASTFVFSGTLFVLSGFIAFFKNHLKNCEPPNEGAEETVEKIIKNTEEAC